MQHYFLSVWEEWFLMVHICMNASCLTGGIPNFPLYMGISGNILDLNYNAYLDMPIILSEWASQCVAAYNINQTSCTFAGKSMKATNPVSDVLSRIASITSALATSAQPFDNEPADILAFSSSIPNSLIGPWVWPYLDELFTTLEQDLENYIPPPPTPPPSQSTGGDDQPVSVLYNENLTLSSYNFFGSPPYAVNPYSFAAVTCVDGSLENILTTDTFAQYIEGQISQNATIGAIMAYQEVVNFPMCLSWPNATLNNAEIYRSAFPSSVKNKILMIAETFNVAWSYEGAFATYQYVGSENAVWFIHDAIGDGVYWDPNNCTYNGIREFLVAGMTLIDSRS